MSSEKRNLSIFLWNTQHSLSAFLSSLSLIVVSLNFFFCVKYERNLKLLIAFLLFTLQAFSKKLLNISSLLTVIFYAAPYEFRSQSRFGCFIKQNDFFLSISRSQTNVSFFTKKKLFFSISTISHEKNEIPGVQYE